MNTSISISHENENILNSAGGGITPADVVYRAREIAALHGRPGDEPTLEDQQQALAELSGQSVHPTLNDDGQSVGAATRDPSQGVVYFDNQVSAPQDADGQESLERMALDGVEEAQREQMAAARRRGL